MPRNVDELIETPISEVMKWEEDELKSNNWQILSAVTRDVAWIKNKVKKHDEVLFPKNKKNGRLSPKQKMVTWGILIGGTVAGTIQGLAGMTGL